ncbi:uncharacterized protein LOC122029387 [Zingiber officinale]|uniref:uncharacterized protein LOC122029387 n=1 Tax=Zingiber officinale TaxID=94328 RepID=UPI001C4C5AC6|nr:uncharacterized protein LOC122029387 [Zingiber officinale]
MSIAQIIFEQIIHPNIYEVTQLSTTNREIGGFGSTDVQSSTGSNSKKKKSKSKAKYSTGRWDTLGQPSGKFDYYVNYDIPKALPDLELPPPSWDDEVVEESKPNLDVQLPKEKHALSAFLEEEALSPKEASKDLAGTTSPWASVPRSKDPFDDIPEEDSNFSYIQYLAQLSQPKDAQLSPPKDVIWDSYEDIEEFGNPFASESSQLLATGYEMEYPILRNLINSIPRQEANQQIYSTSTVVSPYQPPADIAMGLPGYPPTVQDAGPATQQPSTQPIFRNPKFQRNRNTEMWTLPSAQQRGAIFVIPEQLGLFQDVFSRWESITLNHVAAQGFTDPAEKIEYMENLLGEMEKLIWIQWRMTYSNEYDALIQAADGRRRTQNILSQMRRVFSSETTVIQDEAYRDLEKLSCDNMKNILQYMNDYMRLASKTGRLYTGPELSEKFWFKMPRDLGKRIKETVDEKYKGLTVGVIPRVLFAYKFLEQECKDAAFKRSLKDLSFCSQIPIPGIIRDQEDQE